MSREKLREAIKMVPIVGGSTQISDWQEMIDLLLAAARAYACERCGGSGRVIVDMHPWKCPDCAEWRRMADGGEG